MGKRLLDLLKARRVQLNKEKQKLNQYEGVVLHTAHEKGTKRVYYYEVHDGKRAYVGNEKSALVMKVKKYRYLDRAITIVDNDIALLEKLVNGYGFTDFKEISRKLAKTYRLEKLDYNADLPEAAREWLAAKEAEKASYGPWYPAGLIHTVSNGIKVRTKSEMVIAEILLRNGIPFVYELPHILKNGEVVHTDFTILSIVDYKTELLLEHEGSMDDPKYRDKHSWRVEKYYSSGYVPNVNLFFTFDGANGSVDGEAIQRIIDGWLKPAA